jgi:hypothetical protein
MSPEQLRKRTEEMQTTLPTSEAVAVGAQKRAVEAYVQGYQTRRFCIEQAVKAADGKQWTPDDVSKLAWMFHHCVTVNNATQTETTPESPEV